MRRRALTAAFSLGLVAACGGAKPAPPAAVPRTHKLPAPLALDATEPGAMYLTLFAAHVQPNWAQFLEDCRLRLAPTHPLNDAALVAVAELAIERSGAVTLGEIHVSGNADFDAAVHDVLADVHSVEPPPTDLLGDDDRLHLAWTFARDGRQAGPGAAQMEPLQQNVLDVTSRLLEHGELPRAARRVALANGDVGADDAARLVALAALQEALGGSVDVRVVAVDAIGRARVAQLVQPTRALLHSPLDSNLQLAVTRSLAALDDSDAIEPIAGLLQRDVFVNEARALADTRALVELGAGKRAEEIIRAQLLGTVPPKQIVPGADAVTVALYAHALAPSVSLDPTFDTWFAKGDPRLRAGVCAGQPRDASARMGELISRGLRDADASVRASCAEAAGRQLDSPRYAPPKNPLPYASSPPRFSANVPASAATRAVEKRLEKQLRDLLRDRDRLVRARAYAALSVALGPSGRNHMYEKARRSEDSDVFTLAATDPDPEVRTVAIRHYGGNVLFALLDDPDPGVRAAAFTAWAAYNWIEPDAAPAVIAMATRFANDSAATVRLAAIPELTDEALLAKLAAGDTNDVASAALIRLAGLRGRSASTSSLLLTLAKAPPASADRVRIALAWLLAP